MLNIKCTYWKICDVTQNSDLEEWYGNVLKSLCKHKIAIANTFGSLYNLCVLIVMTLCIHSHWGGIHGLKTAQAHCSLQNYFDISLVFISVLGWAMYSLPPGLVWQTQGGFHTLLMNSGGKMYTTSWSTKLLVAVYLEQRPPGIPLFVEVKLASFSSYGQSYPALFSDLHGHIALAHLHWTFFHCRGLFSDLHPITRPLADHNSKDILWKNRIIES